MHQPEADHRAALAHQAAGLDACSARGPRCRTPRSGRRAPAPRAHGVEDAPAGHLEHHVHLVAARWPRSARPFRSSLAGIHRRVGAQLERQRALLLRAGGRDHPAGAERLGELHRQAAHAAGAARSPPPTHPSRACAQVRYRCQAVRPWISSASAAPSSSPSGIGEDGRLVRHRVLGVAAARHAARPRAGRPAVRAAPPRRRAPAAPRSSPGTSSRAGGCRRSSCPRARPRSAPRPSPGSGSGSVHELEHLRPAELLDLDRAHRRASRLRSPPPCALTVVGSIAFDAVKTPFGERERDARRLRRALLARGELLHRRARGGPGGRRLRRRGVRGAPRAAASTPPTSSTSRAAGPSSGPASTSRT